MKIIKNDNKHYSIFDATTKKNLLISRWWDSIGINSVAGRPANITYGFGINNGISKYNNSLCQFLYQEYSNVGDKILDPFAGGSVRGIIAGIMGRIYTGIDVRDEQISENYSQLPPILESFDCVPPNWICGDSVYLNDLAHGTFDFCQTSPPYFNTEIYSNQKNDLSNAENYQNFISRHEKVVINTTHKIKFGGFIVWVVGNFRDKKTGRLIDFRGDCVNQFEKNNCFLWNEYIFETNKFKGTYQSNLFEKSKKNIGIHQFVLVFKKN